MKVAVENLGTTECSVFVVDNKRDELKKGTTPISIQPGKEVRTDRSNGRLQSADM